MSRSFKKTPYACDTTCKKYGKKLANRRVRRHLNNHLDLARGKSYRKLYDSWEISDYGWVCSWEQYKSGYTLNKEDGLYYHNRFYNYDEPLTEKELFLEWYRCYKRK